MTTDRPPSSGRLLFTTLIGAVLILAVLGAMTLLRRQADFRALARETEELAIPTVTVIHPTAGAPEDELVLPGTLQAYADAAIYARTNGYVKKWYHDIGSHVTKGALLAEIDAPEIDQELSQAKAARDQIAASAALAKSSADRWADLGRSNAVSKQEVDEKQSAAVQLQASLAASAANVRRLEEMTQFTRIEAPFDGVITRRNVDDGTLVNSGNGGAQQQLFHLAQMDPIRVFVSVPEGTAAAVHAGLKARLELTQFPSESFQGTVARTSGSIDPATRTLLAEVDVPNGRGRLLPGGYAQVHLGLSTPAARVLVPANALLFRSEGLRAAVVDATHHIHLRALTIGRDYGTSLEVVQGLEASEWIVVNPADSLDDGMAVKVEQPAKN